jgi:hypothetical protein
MAEYVKGEVTPGIYLEWDIDDAGDVEIRSNLEPSEAEAAFKALFPDWMVEAVRDGK